eukprot:366239-Chlamydomonas_euryale.AAC.31
MSPWVQHGGALHVGRGCALTHPIHACASIQARAPQPNLPLPKTHTPSCGHTHQSAIVPYASASPVNSCIWREISSTSCKCLIAAVYWPCRRDDAARPRYARRCCTLSPTALDSMSAFSNRTIAAAPLDSCAMRVGWRIKVGGGDGRVGTQL